MRRRLRHTAGRPAAFTLVELLVVIGIIAVMVGILLPTLSKARERAKATVCLGNLRSVGQTCQVYASNNRGAVPLGYIQDHPYWGNLVRSSDDKFPLFGKLFKSKLMDAPETFYCPSQQEDRYKYNTSENPWPGSASPGTGAVYIGYTSRPIEAAQWAPAGANSGSMVTGMQAIRLQDFEGGQAIMADLVGIPGRTFEQTAVHGKSVNVLMSDLSARTAVPDKANYEANQVTLAGQSAGGTVALSPIYIERPVPVFPILPKGIWDGLER
ncbi:MAG: xcpT 1 [Phycisphaerales bacterium]|nr:xcpT 1 [Phycisphaerales bacterium]